MEFGENNIESTSSFFLVNSSNRNIQVSYTSNSLPGKRRQYRQINKSREYDRLPEEVKTRERRYKQCYCPEDGRAESLIKSSYTIPL